MCTVDQDSACGRTATAVTDFFYMNRSPQTTKALYQAHVDESGEVTRKRGDFSTRMGLTQEPIVDEDLNSVSPLHSLMRTFSFVLLLLYHLRSCIFMWTESSLQMGRSYRFFAQAKTEAKEHVKTCTGMGITMDAADLTGKGGNTNKGDVCQRLMTQHKDVLVECVPEVFHESFKELIDRLWVCIKVYTGTSKVNIEEYKKFCIETYEFLLDNFSNTNRWISISPTLHSLLAHSWEIISANDGVVLGEYTEGGLENSNKFLRFYRTRLSRKNSQSFNLYDCITHLWLRGDPAIRGSKPTSRVYKKKVSKPQRSFDDRHLEKLLEM